MKNVIGLLLIVLLLASCCYTNNIVEYHFGELIVSRVDKCGETSFYYGTGNKLSPGRIVFKYSGINDGFSGYLRFTGNKVEILSGDGYFQNENIDTTKFNSRRIVASQRPQLEENVYYFSLSMQQEINRNNKSVTKVKAIYKTDGKD